MDKPPVNATLGPNILFLDVETSPIRGWTWGMHEQEVISVDQHSHMLSFSCKWQHEKRIKTFALPDFPGYTKDLRNDKLLVTMLWNYISWADIVVAHNGDKFDMKKANARFVFHGLTPPPPVKTIDTLKIARRYFKFDSNKLDDLGKYLGLGEKLAHTGFKLWKDCMLGDMKAWKLMKQYNEQDIVLLEKIYMKLRSWDTSHPNTTVYKEGYGKEKMVCKTCGSFCVQKRGVGVLRDKKYQRIQCQDCGRWGNGGMVK